MTFDKIDISSTKLVHSFLHHERHEGENLIKILGTVKPNRNSKSSISALVRGLITKNLALLAILEKTTQNINSRDVHDEKIFNELLNRFIEWVDDNGLLLFEKYLSSISNATRDTTEYWNLSIFSGPILHCHFYVTFIDLALDHITNPFKCQKLKDIQYSFSKLVKSFEYFKNLKELNNISFDNVRKSSEYSDSQIKVSSFFKLSQITDRSQSEVLFQTAGMKPIKCELLLLNLVGGQDYNHNALALLSSPEKEDGQRSLMYPPFRVNELSIKSNFLSIFFRSLNFGTDKSNFKFVLSLEDESQFTHWYQKLSMIFPTESGTPSDGSFQLIQPSIRSHISGLGINIEHSGVDSIREQNRKHLLPKYDSRQNLNLSSNQNFKQSDHNLSSLISADEETSGSPFSLRPPSDRFGSSRKNSSSSISSINSVRSQYDRSLDLICKNLGSSNQTSDEKDGRFLKFINRYKCLKSEDAGHERPLSSRAEIEYFEEDSDSEENKVINKPIKDDRYQMLPKIFDRDQEDKSAFFSEIINGSSNHSTLFKTSNGSEIDVSNFGKNYSPDFERPIESIRGNKKKSFLGLFKKNFSEADVSRSDLHLDASKLSAREEQSRKSTSIKESTSVTRLQSKEVTVTSSDNMLPAKGGSTKESSVGPSPFALPSSTSMHFFKPHAHVSSSKVNKSNMGTPVSTCEEETLKIPQKLKDIINDERSIDFFISSSAPDTMKISKWKSKYGKWEMLTVSKRVFIKIVVNYDLMKGWLIFFKEDFDDDLDEMVDTPISLLNIHRGETSIRASSGLDVQITAIDSITFARRQIMVRCANNEIANSIITSMENVIGVLQSLSPKIKFRHSPDPKLLSASNTSSYDKLNREMPSASILDDSPPFVKEDRSISSLSSETAESANIIDNNDNTKLIIIDAMPIRLQRHTEQGKSMTNPSSWKILSMYALTVFLISDSFTHDNYYHILLTGSTSDQDERSWLIPEKYKSSRLQRIGKAGLLVKVSDEEIFMVECKGKKEFKRLYSVF